MQPQVLNKNSIVIRYPKEMFEEYTANDVVKVVEDVCLEAQVNRILTERKVCILEVFIYHVNPKGEVITDKHKLENCELSFENEEDLTDTAIAQTIVDMYNQNLIEQALRMFYEESLYQTFLREFNKNMEE